VFSNEAKIKANGIIRSIVAVHGLNPLSKENHAEETWTAPNGQLWLKDFLPTQIPKARIFLFGYNANTAFSTGNSGVLDQATALLVKLSLEWDDTPGRPIIFISHSLGGLIVKRAIVEARSLDTYKSLLEAVHGLVFFGTPHRGGNKAGLGDVAASVARFVLSNPANSYLEALKKNSFFAESLRYDFANRQEEFSVVTFYEEKPTKLGLVVEKDSAVMGLSRDRETVLGLAADHSGICKFEDAEGLDYRPVWKLIKKLVDNALKEVEINRALSEMNVPGEASDKRTIASE
jgi:hypothetical protein